MTISLFHLLRNYQWKQLGRFQPRTDEELDIFNRCRDVVYANIYEFHHESNKYPPFLYKKIIIDDYTVEEDELHSIIVGALSYFRKSHCELYTRFRVKSHRRDVIDSKRHFMRHPLQYKMIYSNPMRYRHNIHMCGCDRCNFFNMRNKPIRNNKPMWIDDFIIPPPRITFCMFRGGNSSP